MMPFDALAREAGPVVPPTGGFGAAPGWENPAADRLLLVMCDDLDARLRRLIASRGGDGATDAGALAASTLRRVAEFYDWLEVFAATQRGCDAAGTLPTPRAAAARHLAGLTARQVEVMQRVLAGEASKTIAFDLGISRRTVETHRASIRRKTGCRSLPALTRLASAAEG